MTRGYLLTETSYSREKGNSIFSVYINKHVFLFDSSVCGSVDLGPHELELSLRTKCLEK